ncbi:hypothetical protein BDR26DRAFT_883406 [Obelidium mucronatum]|nr:hypothetical protein BDR26DRAFT_883406 [Obelidium mucronatum]
MDSLCVDQSCYPDGSSTPSSNEDRARFIPRMSEIFTKAEIVAGYADDSEDAGCTDWYDRLWILQEMVLAKRLMIYRGRWSSLAEERVFWGKKATLKGEEGLLGVRILSELGAACLGVCNGERKLSLAQIARLTAQRQCFCPQDRIYGIFGLLSFKTRIVPDYKDSVDVVWRRLCQEAVTEHGDLSVLLSRCSDFGEGQSILLETAKLPEIAQGLDIDWRNDLVAVEADRWKFTHHVPVSVKVINGVGPASMRSQESTKAVDFLETELMGLITSNSPELSAKLEWVCKSLFVLSKVHEKQRPVGFSGSSTLGPRGRRVNPARNGVPTKGNLRYTNPYILFQYFQRINGPVPKRYKTDCCLEFK